MQRWWNYRPWGVCLKPTSTSCRSWRMFSPPCSVTATRSASSSRNKKNSTHCHTAQHNLTEARTNSLSSSFIFVCADFKILCFRNISAQTEWCDHPAFEFCLRQKYQSCICRMLELELMWSPLTLLRHPHPISRPPTAIVRVINTRSATGQWADAGVLPSCQAEFHPSQAVSLNTAGWTIAQPLSTAGHCPAWIVCLENNMILIDFLLLSPLLLLLQINRVVIITIKKV